MTDSTGAIIPGASVTVSEALTGTTAQTTANGEADFTFRSLPAGKYSLEVQAPGFAPYKIANIVLDVSQTLNFAAQLKVGTTTQEVTVEANAVTVDTETSAVQSIVNQESVADLPLDGRNPAALMYTVSGVNNALTAGQWAVGNSSVNAGNMNIQGEAVASVHGSRIGGMYFSLDGGTNVDPMQVHGGPFPNPDLTSEFSVQTASYGARYVSAPGGAVNIITRSGANQVHGSVFEFIRNPAVNAQNYFGGDFLKRNQFGGAIGGPIKKDRIFFFGGYQGTREVNANAQVTYVPTAAQRSGVLSGLVLDPDTFFLPGGPFPIGTPGAPPADGYFDGTNTHVTVDPVNNRLLAYIPTATSADGSMVVYGPSNYNEEQWVAKVDETLGSHRLFARYFGQLDTSPTLPAIPGSLLGEELGNSAQWQNGTLGDTWSHGNLLNDFRFTYLFTDLYFAKAVNPISLDELGAKITPSKNPYLGIQNVEGDFVLAQSGYSISPRHNIDYADNLTLLKSKHTISAGFEIQRIVAAGIADTAQDPLGIYPGTFQLGTPGPTGFTNGHDPRVDFILGAPTVFINGDGEYSKLAGTLWGFHLEDAYKASGWTTLTVGLRYDPYLPFKPTNGYIGCFAPGQQSTVFPNAPAGLTYPGDSGCSASGTKDTLSLVEPRVGLAQRLDNSGKTSLRVGYGMYAQQVPVYSLGAFSTTVPFIRTYALILPGYIDAPWASSPVGDPFASTGYNLTGKRPPSNVAFPSYPVPPSATSISPGFQPSYLQQYTLSIQRALSSSEVVEIDYVGTKATHLTMDYPLNNPVCSGWTIPAQAAAFSGICANPAANTGALTGTEQARRLIPTLGTVYQIRSDGNSNYNGLEASFKHTHKGLFVNSEFNFSKAFDDGSLPGLTLPGLPAENESTNHSARYGLSSFDQTFTWRNTVVYTMPALAGKSRMEKTLIGGWNVNAIYSMESGTPYTVTNSSDNSFTGDLDDFADRVPGVPLYISGQSRAQKVKEAFNTAAFTPNALTTYGNAGRNILRAPGYLDLDMGLQKVFPIHEATNFSLRFEAFNLTNHPNLYGPNSTVGQTSFGQILTAKDPRILQASARISF